MVSRKLHKKKFITRISPFRLSLIYFSDKIMDDEHCGPFDTPELTHPAKPLAQEKAASRFSSTPRRYDIK